MLRLPKDVSCLVPSETANRRSAGRVRSTDARCSLGKVLDLSASGVSVERRFKPPTHTDSQPVVLWIEADGAPRIALGATLVRSVRTGFFRYSAAYRFEGVTPEKQAALLEIARCSVRHETGFHAA